MIGLIPIPVTKSWRLWRRQIKFSSSQRRISIASSREMHKYESEGRREGKIRDIYIKREREEEEIHRILWSQRFHHQRLRDPRMADKRQLNLNHEYERTEREGGQDGESEVEREREWEARRGQRKPRRQSGGSFVTVMASTPGLQSPRLAPPSRLPATHTTHTRATLEKSIYLYNPFAGSRVFPVGKNLDRSSSRNEFEKEKKWIDIFLIIYFFNPLFGGIILYLMKFISILFKGLFKRSKVIYSLRIWIL